MPASPIWHWIALVIAALLAVGGLIVVLLALFRDRSRGRPRCPKCWYDMAGVTGLKCPECGREARSTKRLHKTRRRWRRATLGALMLLLAGVTAVGAPLLQHGVLAGTPTWGYIAALPWIGSGPALKELEQRVKAGNTCGPNRDRNCASINGIKFESLAWLQDLGRKVADLRVRTTIDAINAYRATLPR